MTNRRPFRPLQGTTGTTGWVMSRHDAMPPARFATRVSPALRRIAVPNAERFPVWQTTTTGLSAGTSAAHARAQRKLKTFRELESEAADLGELAEMAAEDEEMAGELQTQLGSVERRLGDSARTLVVWSELKTSR